MEECAFAAVGLTDQRDTQPPAAAIVRAGERNRCFSYARIVNGSPRSRCDDAPGTIFCKAKAVKRPVRSGLIKRS